MTENRRREDSNVFDQVVRILATKAAGLGFSKQYMVSENRLIKAQGIVWRGFNVLWRLRNLWIHINRILEAAQHTAPLSSLSKTQKPKQSLLPSITATLTKAQNPATQVPVLCLKLENREGVSV
ncbi:PREDICTED: uncharacterized protein LOC101294579 [Fragaria vesca subsp. vesca]